MGPDAAEVESSSAIALWIYSSTDRETSSTLGDPRDIRTIGNSMPLWPSGQRRKHVIILLSSVDVAIGIRSGWRPCLSVGEIMVLPCVCRTLNNASKGLLFGTTAISVR